MSELILTIGPASEHPDIIKAMALVATRFRLNASHLQPQRLQQWLETLQLLYRDSGKTVTVVLDLQGAKVRIGTYPAVERTPKTMELQLAKVSEDPAIIPVPHSSVFAKTKIGDTLHLNDRKVILRVIAKPSSERLTVECVQSGPLSSGKGLNCPERFFELGQVNSRDREAINIGNRFPFVEYAISFVCDGTEAALFRPITDERRLTAKIERPVALASLPTIDRDFDELWLCRGDLGAEAELRDLGRLQQDFVSAFPRLIHPKILAGEVLGSMVHSPLPSRSEIVHLHDILQDGFDGIVLSDETASGNHVPEVIRFLEYFFAKRNSH